VVPEKADWLASGEFVAPGAESLASRTFPDSVACGSTAAKPDKSGPGEFAGAAGILKAGFNNGFTMGNGGCEDEGARAKKFASGDASSEEAAVAVDSAGADAFPADWEELPSIARMMESAIVSGVCVVYEKADGPAARDCASFDGCVSN